MRDCEYGWPAVAAGRELAPIASCGLIAMENSLVTLTLFASVTAMLKKYGFAFDAVGVPLMTPDVLPVAGLLIDNPGGSAPELKGPIEDAVYA